MKTPISEMLKKTFRSALTVRRQRENELLALELSEIKDIADILFGRIEKKIEELKNIEVLVDEKIKFLKDLIKRAESLASSSESSTHFREVITLSEQGLKIDEIARILDMPAGEVELILNLATKRH
jgi:DNA-directed RNA polymerase specialized sigma24 family protein